MPTWLKWVGGFVTLATAVSLLFGAITLTLQALDRIATKEYHDISLQSFEGSLNNIEAAAVVQRLQNLLQIRCRADPNLWPHDLDELINEQRARYRELMDREFGVGSCRDGEYRTRYEP